MPMYEYQCPKGHRFEKIEKFTAAPVQKCPQCGAKAERQISRSAVKFKGSGWYVTDYGGKSSSGESANTDKTASSESSGDSNSKTELKAAANSDSKGAAKTDAKSESKPTKSGDGKSGDGKSSSSKPRSSSKGKD